MKDQLGAPSLVSIVTIAGNGDLSACFEIRRQVFIQGQQVPEELEIDGLDSQATHYLLQIESSPIGTARVRFPKNGQAKIERVAILPNYQGRGLGRTLMDFILRDLRLHNTLSTVVLGAQLQVIPFYEKLGFVAYGNVFLEANIEHRWMMLTLDS